MTGRPRTFDRDVALEQAMHAFWEQGYAATTVSHLTRRIGIAAPSLYAAFGDKQALFDEVTELYVGRLEERLHQDLAAPTARAAVEAVLRTAADAFTATGTPAGCLVMGEPLLASRRAATREAIAGRLHRAVATGELTSHEEADELGAYLDTVLAGLEARARDGADTRELQTAVARALRAWPPTPRPRDLQRVL